MVDYMQRGVCDVKDILNSDIYFKKTEGCDLQSRSVC